MQKLFSLLLLCAIVGCTPGDKSDTDSTSQTASASAPVVVGTLSVGDSRGSFDTLASSLGAEDLTPGMAIIGPTGQHPLQGIVWGFADFGAVVSVSFDDADNLTHLDYCKVADFGVSKSHRSNSTIDISSIAFNSDNTTSRVLASGN